MRGKAAIGAGLLAMIGTPALATPGPGPGPGRAPDLASCPRIKQAEGWERERSRPLAIPTALRGLVKSDLLHLAVATLDGKTACVDTSFMESTSGMALTPDGRFLSFGWLGYEAYGHYLIDRAGKGKAIETGVTPTFSPSRRYFAAADQTESEFGALSGLAVWEVGPTGTTEIGRINELPRMSGWRIDSWRSESCIALSALPLEQPDEKSEQARIRFRAGPGKASWTISRNARGCDAR